MSEVPSNLIPTRITQLPYAPVASEESLLLIVYEGNTYQIMAGDLLQVAGVPTSRQVIAGTGMTGGGQLTDNVTLSIAPKGVGSAQLADSGVTSGTYGTATEVPVFTVDETGRVVAASTIPVQVSGYVPTTREVIAGDGLNGGGPLNANVTLSANLSDATPLAVNNAGSAGVSLDISRADHTHPAVDLGDDNEVDGVLGLNNGGTARSIVPDEGAIIWCGADGLYVGPVGVSGQLLQSVGAGEYVWVTPSNLSVGSADNINGGDVNQLVVQTAPDTTGFVPAPTIASTFLKYDGSDLIWDSVAGAGTVTSVALSLPAEFDVTGSPITSAGTLTGNWAVQNANLVFAGPATGSATAPGFRSLVNADIPTTLTGKTIDDGVINNTTIGSLIPSSGVFTTLNSTSVATGYIDFDTAATTVDAIGRLRWDTADNAQTLSLGMAGGSVVQQIGEELYYRIKASSAITNGQVVMFTGSVGASGGLTGAPATGLLPDQSNYVMGVATEDIANNGWGYVTYFGVVRGVNTTGGAEAWADGDILYYNPLVTGGMTKNKPAAPNPIVIVAAVVHAATNGVLFIRPTYGSTFGGTDGNVSFSSLTNGDVIVYDGALQYWKNVTQSTLAVGTATNIAGGAAGSIPYQTGAGATALLAAGSGVLVGGSTPSYSTAPSLAGTNFSAIPNAALSNSSLTIGTTSVSLGATSLTLAGLTSVTLTQDPVSNLQAATKQYVDTLVASGITYHAAVKYEVPDTTGNLNATYNNGTAGVGATLTNAGTLAAFTPDGVVAQVGDRILIYNQTNAYENGVYEVTTVGSGSVAWVLTRTTDADSYGLKDPNALGEGDAFFVTSGNTGAGETYVCNTTGTITFGTTAITFTQVSSSQVYSAGNGLQLTSTQFSLITPVTAVNGGTGISGYAVGDLIFANTTTTLDRITVGSTGTVLVSNGTAPGWSAQSTLSVGSASNLVGGAASQIPYQTAADTTAFIANGTAGQVLKSNGTSAPSWSGIDGGTF